MAPPSRRPSDFSKDTSTLVRHRHSFDPYMPKFEVAFGLWASTVGISRNEFTSLREILGMLDNAQFQSLPASLPTLKRRLNRQLPLLDMRTKEIPLIPENLPTETATRKAQGVDKIPHETLHFIDPEAMFKAFMSSDIVKDMHIGMAHWVDTPSELWESRCWSSSLRTTSGQYAHFKPIGAQDRNDQTGDPIFPSEWV